MMPHPRIREVIYVAPQKDWSFPLHQHNNSAELSLILNGSGSFYSANKNQPVKKGMLVVKNPGLSHAEKSDPADPLEQICIEIEDIQIDGLPEKHILPPHVDPVLTLSEDFALMRACFNFFLEQNQSNVDESLNEKILAVILALIERQVKNKRHSHEKRPRSKKALVSDVLEYLDGHYQEKLTIKDLANYFYVSEGNLSRQFKKVTGFTLNEYLISKRMGEAQRLLLFEDKDIKDISALCGYNDVSYFYHVFKSYAHCTPVEFRMKYKTGKS